MTSKLLHVLQTAPSTELFAYFTDERTSEAEGRSSMQWLLAQRPEVAQEVLCELYGIDVFALPQDCGAQQEAPRWAYADATALSHCLANLRGSPGFSSYNIALRQAVQGEELEKAFFSERLDNPILI